MLATVQNKLDARKLQLAEHGNGVGGGSSQSSWKSTATVTAVSRKNWEWLRCRTWLRGQLNKRSKC
eukprot:scaffold34221_cov34-Tisochrysis_lutea.AAC.2